MKKEKQKILKKSEYIDLFKRSIKGMSNQTVSHYVDYINHFFEEISPSELSQRNKIPDILESFFLQLTKGLDSVTGLQVVSDAANCLQLFFACMVKENLIQENIYESTTKSKFSF